MTHHVDAFLMDRVAADSWVAEPGQRVLDVLEGYPPQTVRLSYLPVTSLGELDRLGTSGDVIGFVSTRPDLDVFHVGLLARDGDGVLRLRHASRSAGASSGRTVMAREPRE